MKRSKINAESGVAMKVVVPLLLCAIALAAVASAKVNFSTYNFAKYTKNKTFLHITFYITLLNVLKI